MSQSRELSRRERQIMSIVYERGEASATEVWQELSDPPSRTSVRTLLRILEEKGYLRHAKRGREFVYKPIQARLAAGQSAFQSVLRTFFDGSLEKAVAAHLADDDAVSSDAELRRLASLIREVRKQEREDA